MSGAETESFISAAEEIDDNSDITLSSAEKEVTSRTTIERQDGDTQIYFSATSNPDHISGSNVRIPCASSSVQFSPFPGVSVHLSPRKGQKTDLCTLQSKVGGNSVANKGPEIKHEPNLTGASAAVQESCEKWRLRGNQAYSNGDSSKAEEYYTRRISCIPASETSKSCLRELMLCYSNRAATCMSLGRMKDALVYSMMAIAIDPTFSRVQLRAANCYLSLGEVENSMRGFRKCLQSGTGVCVDRKFALEASDSLQKSQKLSECMHRSAELLQISLYSEKLLERKEEALSIAIFRRATLYQMIRDYGQAASDIERFISLLMNQMETKTSQFGASAGPKNLANDLRQARLWLSEIKEEGGSNQLLQQLAEIKKAALRHHPDKAVQSLVRHENGDDRLWKEIREDAYKDADRLFKIIGEAYAILSDPDRL